MGMTTAKVFSFSIFDALLTKQVATPAGVYCAIQHQLRTRIDASIPIQVIEEFFEIRISAEVAVRKAFTADEISLDRIYGEIARRFPEVPFGTIQALQQLELDTEEMLAVGIPSMLAEARALLDAGHRVVLVADTPLPGEAVRRLLRKADLRIAECPLYLSASTTKRSCWSNLFKRILREEAISPNQLVHRTHSLPRHLKMRNAMGIGWSLCKAALMTELETCYLEENSLFSQLLAGTSRNFRVLHPDASPQAIMGACLAGPMFYGFIRDVLRQAEDRGIPRLFFIARDGMVFLRIAQAIAREHGSRVELRYLYGSRRAFRLPSMFELSPREFGWLSERIPTLSLSMLAERVDMTGEQLHGLLSPKLQKRISDLEASLSPTLTRLLLDELAAPEVRAVILDNARCSREKLIAYLDQEGFFGGERVGTVDIGWMGGTQDSLYKVAASHKRDIELQGFYFGLFHYSAYTTVRNGKTPYALIPNHADDNIVALHTELLAQADHGQTVGFRRGEDGRMGPVFSGDGAPLRAWGVGDFHAGVEWFASEFAKLTRAYPLSSQNFLSVVPRLLQIMKKPSRRIADTLGSVPYSGDHCDLRLRESAPPLTIGQALAYSFFQRYENRRIVTEWYEASLVRSSFPVKLILKLQPPVQAIKHAFKYALVQRTSLPAARKLAGIVRQFGMRFQ